MTSASLRNVLFVLWFACTSMAGAATTPAQIASIEGVSEYRLANGLRVLLVPSAESDTITVHITYLVGSRHEGYGEKGMAHLLEHLLFKGSPRHPDPKREFMRRGARWNGTTSQDRTTYFESFPARADNLDWALDLEADRMRNARLAKADLDSEMTVVRNEFESGENDPGSILIQRMQRLAYAWHNYGYPIIGERSDLERVPIERLRAFYRTWYRPDNAVLIVAGRLEVAPTLARVQHHFGRIPRPSARLPTLYTVEPTADGERAVTLRRTGETQLVSVLYRVPSARHPDYPAIEVLVRILAQIPSGRLYQALVKRGLASGSWGSDRGMHDPGTVLFGAHLQKDQPIDAARAALLAALEAIATDPIRDDEVARAKTELLNSFEQAQIALPVLVRSLSEFSALGDWRLFFLHRERLREVETADVQRAALDYLKRSNRVLGIFVPTEQPDRSEIAAAPDLADAYAAIAGAESVAPGERFDPSPQAIESRVVRTSLANDMKLVLLPKSTRGGRVTLQLSLHWGDEQSRMNRNAACTMAGELLMRGTRSRSRADLVDAFEALNASVSVGAGGASLQVRGDRLPDAIALLAEVLTAPAFSHDELVQAKRAALTHLDSQRSQPQTLASVALRRHLNPYPTGHPRHVRSLDERAAELRELSIEDVTRCYEELFGATGAEIAVIGDVDPDLLKRALERALGGWRTAAPYRRIVRRHFAIEPDLRRIAIADKANAVLRGGLNIRMRDDHPDYPALVLANRLIGGSSSSRLAARIREKDGLSYSVYSWFEASPLDEAASFNVAAIFAPRNRARIERALREELRRAVQRGFSDAEVAQAANGLIEARKLARTRDATLADQLARYRFIDRDLLWDAALERRLAALDAAAVNAALRRHIDPDRLSLVAAGDFAQNDAAAPKR